MKGLTNYITQSTWSDILTVIYVLVDDSYKQMNPALRPKRKFAPHGTPEFSDSEVITIALFAEIIFGGDEGIQKILGYLRHRVETTFSVLTTVFNFERPTRQFAGRGRYAFFTCNLLN